MLIQSSDGIGGVVMSLALFPFLWYRDAACCPEVFRWRGVWLLCVSLLLVVGVSEKVLADDDSIAGAGMFKVLPEQVSVKQLSGDMASNSSSGDFHRGFTIDVDVRAPVPRQVAYAVLSDFSRMAAFVPNLERSEVLSRNGNRLRVFQQGQMRYGWFSVDFESVREVDLLPDRILAKSVSGTARHMESELRFDASSVERETRFHYHAWVVPETGLPPLIGPAAVRNGVAEQFSAMVQEMMRRLAPGG